MTLQGALRHSKRTFLQQTNALAGRPTVEVASPHQSWQSSVDSVVPHGSRSLLLHVLLFGLLEAPHLTLRLGSFNTSLHRSSYVLLAGHKEQ